ncbi:MAG TPA: fibronectin-binding domain-containing protein [Candidatus Bathyarchaeota archaeon]|nr:fibronectin-binding domain-containing protein [Candidatus Bathyarchaeota archaeon]
MVALREALSGLDIAALVRELAEAIKGSRLSNIYQLSKDKFLFKLRSPGTTYKLLVDLGRYACLTKRDVEVPGRPPPFCMGLRKDLRGGLVADVRQHDLDRVLELLVSTRSGEARLILELFAGGNLILVGPGGQIRRVLRPRAMRDRDLLVGQPYRYPPGPRVDLARLRPPDLEPLRELGDLEVVRGLSRLTGLGSPYVEEVLLRAEVEKGKPCASLTDEDLSRISRSVRDLVRAVVEGPLEPMVVVGDGGKWLDVVPIRLLKYEGLSSIRFRSLSEAIDAYFSRLAAGEAISLELKAIRERIEKLKRRIEKQEGALRRFKEESSYFSSVGDTIFTYLSHLNFLLEALRELRDELGSWEAVRTRLDELRSRGPPFSWLTDIRPSGPTACLKVNNIALELNLRQTAQEVASSYYEKAKKARRKAEGAAKALEESKRELISLLSRLKELESKAPEPLGIISGGELPVQAPAKPRRAWYESFRWFLSSDGLLVVAGKDAATNELIVKRYPEPGDLLLHAEIPGAPFVLVKAGGREVPRDTLLQAAQLAVSYSRAWKYGLGAATAICFKPEQARKVGPHGEKLPKGAFYIVGRKDYIRGVELKLAIGASREAGQVRLLLGPVEAVRSRSEAYVLIGPGDEEARGLVLKAIKALEDVLGPLGVDRESLERLAALVPYGRGRLLSGAKRCGH